ncbi:MULTISPECIES: BlaI/MecI/CopY family transcriptional regulator [unclassified Kaistella]|uniref:BlaI/MecI/CopY family transcriptional regulator n=1 Tax=unclassified Kaistella TaxID=2762626 RepID=UPI002733CDE4|nr:MULTISPECIES: BlaI/MecI/CopY family transcriptional regulator [unclassified Kaistella]MDP2453978.1 BlaI/MecI/CopY family transcriptional regulator [Kaistella sp. SH11-4b]MDP2457035.1 BlaI/MecI/CopY family transcriptional regulator [Kaistella sp. SH40-3]MDP2459792.1 BlaI/MecI/CopY family transcriptional regulator [Kaistella sp. SH19-2b]
MKISHLTPGEEILMKVLWQLDTAYMRDIVEQYPEPKPHPNTISTFLKILVEKEFLTTEKEGRVFKYSVAIPFEDYRKYLLKLFLEDYFNDSALSLVKLLIQENLLKDETMENLLNMEETAITVHPKEEESDLSDFLNDITAPKKKKKKKEKSEKKKHKKKDK